MPTPYKLNRQMYLRFPLKPDHQHVLPRSPRKEKAVLEEVIEGLRAYQEALKAAQKLSRDRNIIADNPLLLDLAHAVQRTPAFTPLEAAPNKNNGIAAAHSIFLAWYRGTAVRDEDVVLTAQWARHAFNQGRDIIFAGIPRKPDFATEETEYFGRPQAALNYLGALAYAYDALGQAHFNSHKTGRPVPLDPRERWQMRPRLCKC